MHGSFFLEEPGPALLDSTHCQIISQENSDLCYIGLLTLQGVNGHIRDLDMGGTMPPS